MVRKSRTQRFDEVFQLMLIIEAVLVEFSWTFAPPNEAILTIFLLIVTLFVWALGTLMGGKEGYTAKAFGFYFAFFTLSFLIFFSLASKPIERWLQVLASGIVIPIVDLFLSVRIIYYLREAVDRKWAIQLLIIGTVVLVIMGFLMYLDLFI